MTTDEGSPQPVAAMSQWDPFFDLLLSQSAEAIFVLSPEGRLTRLNAAAERLLAVRAEDYLGRSYHDWPFALYGVSGATLGPFDLEGAVTAALTGRRNHGDILIANAVGERVPARAVIDPVRASDGALLGFVATVSTSAPLPPLTEARLSYLQGAMDLMPIGVIIMDLAQGPVEANAAACRLLGALPGTLDADFVSGRISAVHDPDGRLLTKAETRDLWERLSTAPVANLRVGMAIDGGEPRWLDLCAQPLPTVDGAQRSVMTLTDASGEQRERSRLVHRIAEQEAALYFAEEQVRTDQQELDRYDAQLSAHLDSTIDGVLVTGRDREPIVWNRRFREIFALPEPSVEAISWQNSFPRVKAAFRNADMVDTNVGLLLADETAEILRVWETVDGRSLVLHSLPVRHRDADRIYGRIWTFRDVTDSRRAQRAAEQQAELMQRILDWVPANIFVRDERGRYLLANQYTARAYGAAVADVLGHTDDELRIALGKPPRVHSEMMESDRRIISGEIDDIRYEFPATNTLQGHTDYIAAKTAFTWRDGQRVVLGVSQDVTEQRRMERELITRQRLLQEIIDRMPANIFVKDAERRYVLANQATADSYGVNAEELLGHTDAELTNMWGVPEANLAEAQRTDREVLDGASHADYQIIAEDAQGQTRDYFVTKSPFAYQGQPAILGVSLDMTAQREAERRVARQRAWFQQIIDMIPGNVYVRDTEGRYVLANRNMALAYYLQHGEVLGRTDRELSAGRGVDEEWVAQIERTDRAILDEGSPLERYVFQVPNENGRTEHFMITKVPFALDDGTPAVLGVSVNITRERDADLAERTLDLIYEAAPIGIAVVDRDGVCVRANGALVDILGLPSRGDIEGISVREHPLSRDTVLWRAIAQCLEAGDRITDELQVELYKGAVVLRFGVFPRIDADGVIVGVQLIIEDITAYRRLQDRLVQASKLEALSQLAGGAAHSFRNMLTIVNGFTEMALHNKRLNSRLRAELEQVLEAGRRAGDIARQLLTFSRRNELELSVFDLNEVLREIGRMLPSLLGRKVGLKLQLCQQPLLVHADRTQVEQMIVNLAANARQAMPEGGELTIVTRPRRFNKPGGSDYLDPQPGRYAQLEVRDTGSGLSPDAREHLFEPFFTTKPEGQGTGLGLSMAYGLIQSLGGGIDVRSVSGHGTMFRFFMPRISAQEADDARAAAPRTLPRARHNELLLVIEPEDNAREGLVRLLSRKLGYTVFDAADASEALEICGEVGEPFDLVITPAELPHQAGPELIGQLDATCPVRHVLYTAVAGGQAPVQLAGAPVLPRPFEPAVVAQAVRAALDAPPLNADERKKAANGQSTAATPAQ